MPVRQLKQNGRGHTAGYIISAFLTGASRKLVTDYKVNEILEERNLRMDQISDLEEVLKPNGGLFRADISDAN